MSWAAMLEGRATETVVDDEYCKVCKVAVGDKGMQCDGCGLWHHNKCAEVEPKLYAAINKYDAKNGAGLYWFCAECNGDYKTIRGELQKVKEAMSKIEKEWQIAGEVIKEVRDESKITKANVEEVTRMLEMGKAEMVDKERYEVRNGENSEKELRRPIIVGTGTCKIMQMEVAEAIERDKRRNKLVIMGVPENAQEENKFVREVIDALMPETKVEVVYVGRIGRRCEKDRPLRILVEDNGHRRKILSRAKELKGMEGKERIFIVPDRTRIQQDEDKKLREEVKRLRLAGGVRVRIVRGTVVSEVLEASVEREGVESK
jgi:PHD-finger